jgi:CRP-like cAMP-binding protein
MGTIVDSQSNNVLAGDLKYLGLGDLIQLLGTNGSSGSLRLSNPYVPEPAFIYFEQGNPINALYGEKNGLEALLALFGWAEGEFEFIQEKVIAQKVIQKSRMGIILEGLRLRDDGQIEIVGPNSQFTPKSSTDSSLETNLPIVKGPLIDYMYVVDEEDFFDGEHVVEQGRHGNWIWVILEGVVEILKETPEGPLPIIRVGDGGFVGSLTTFLIHGNMRTASAVAIGNVQLGVLDSQRLAQEYSLLSKDFRKFLASLDKRLRQVTDQIADYHQNNIDDSWKTLYQSKLMVEGKDSDLFYNIRKGSAVVIRNTDNGPVLLSRLEEEDFVGEVPFLNLRHEPDAASVLVSKDFEFEPMDISLLSNEYSSLSTTLKNIINHIASCVSLTSDTFCYRISGE